MGMGTPLCCSRSLFENANVRSGAATGNYEGESKCYALPLFSVWMLIKCGLRPPRTVEVGLMGGKDSNILQQAAFRKC